MSSKLNPENKCSHLYNQEIEPLKNSIKEMFDKQRSLQKYLAKRNRAVNPDTAPFQERVNDITVQWRNLTLEFAELLERLTYKEWKTYTDEQRAGFTSEEHKLEVFYEYVDMWHFFMNIGLNLGITGEMFEKLYLTKNKENFDRQKRGY